MVLYSDIINKGILKDIGIPKKCKCGAPLYISDSLKVLKCINRNCRNRVVIRVRDFVKELGIGIEEEEIEGVVVKLGIVTPYQLLDLEEAKKEKLITYKEIKKLDKVIERLKVIQVQEIELSRLVELSEDAEISKISKRLFSGYNSIEEAYTEIELGKALYINEILGINNSDSMMLSVEIYNRLMELKEELIYGEMKMRIKKVEANNIIKIAFADNIEPFINKSELLEYLNNTYNKQFIHVNSITKNTDILVRNYIDACVKVRQAKLLNENKAAIDVNNGVIEYSQINKFNDTDLKPLGAQVYVDTLSNILKRLDKIEGRRFGTWER